MSLKQLKLGGVFLLTLTMFLSSAQLASADQPVSGISTTSFNEGTDKAAPFYNPVVVSNIKLELPQASVNELNNNPYTAIYQRAAVTITTADGVVTRLNDIGIRLKGQATRTNLYGKAPMKLKFDAFVPEQKFMGLTRMTLNSMAQDPSFIHEAASYRIYRAMGVIAPRTTYSWVTLNNADFGLYMNIESIDEQMLKRWIRPVHLYSSNAYLTDLDYRQNWAFDTNYGDTNRSDLDAAVAVSVLDGEAWWNAVNKIADMDAVIKLMATDIYTSNWDGYTDVVQNNYYAVFDDQGKLRIIPWGQDATFPMDPSAQLDWLGRGPAFRNFGNQTRSVMLRKCVAYDPCVNLLVKAQVAAKNKVAEINTIGFKNKLSAVINNAYISKEVRANSDVWSATYWQNWLDTFFPQRTQSLTDFLKTRNPEATALTLTGSALIGSTLKVQATTWDYTSTLSYQWLRNSQPIANATTSQYVLSPADAATLVSVRATASKTSLPSATSTSVAVLVATPVVAPASITGDARVGGLLVGSPLTSDTAQVSYKWLRAGKAISGATGSTYEPIATDLAKAITLVTTVSQVGYATAVTTSAPIVIQPGVITPPEISIQGSAKTGNILLLSAQAPAGTKAVFQWLRDSAPISGATKSEYKLKADDFQTLISAKVTLTRVGYTTATRTAVGLSVTAGDFVKSATPFITGTVGLNKTVSGNAGSWDSGVTYSYQWLRNGVAVAGANAKTYKLTEADRGKQLTIQVTVTKFGYSTMTQVSSPITFN
jgi:hypothetical protein